MLALSFKGSRYGSRLCGLHNASSKGALWIAGSPEATLLLCSTRTNLRQLASSFRPPVVSPKGIAGNLLELSTAVIIHQGKFVMLYRAQDKNGTATSGYAEAGMAFISLAGSSRCFPRKPIMKKMAA
jgi:hypothetical protein